MKCVSLGKPSRAAPLHSLIFSFLSSPALSPPVPPPLRSASSAVGSHNKAVMWLFLQSLVMMESLTQTHLVKRRILKWLWGARHEAGASADCPEPGWSTFRGERWGCGVWLLSQSVHHSTETDAVHQFIIHPSEKSVCGSDTCLMRRR